MGDGQIGLDGFESDDELNRKAYEEEKEADRRREAHLNEQMSDPMTMERVKVVQMISSAGLGPGDTNEVLNDYLRDNIGKEGVKIRLKRLKTKMAENAKQPGGKKRRTKRRRRRKRRRHTKKRPTKRRPTKRRRPTKKRR